MSKSLVAFFSASGTTKRAAKKLAAATGSGMGRTASVLAPSWPGAKIASGRILNGSRSEAELKQWAESV